MSRQGKGRGLPAIERVWLAVEYRGDCVVYPPPVNARRPWQHPRVWSDGHMKGVHHVSYEAVHGPVPAGLLLRHTCDTAGCVNVDHLVPGTHQQNMDDMTARHRSTSGARHPMARLTPEQVAAIRRADPARSHTSVAAEFGVYRTTVARIRTGRRWTTTGA